MQTDGEQTWQWRLGNHVNLDISSGRQEVAAWRLGAGWMVVAALFFAMMGALVKKAGQDLGFGFYELVFWRTAFAVVVLGILARWRGQRFGTLHWGAHLWRGVAGTLGLLLFFYGITHLPLATAVTLNYTSPLFLALLSLLFLRERIGRQMAWALGLGFAGVVVLLRPTFTAGQEWAGVVALASGLCAGWAYLQVRDLTQRGEPGWRVVFYFSLIATLISAGLTSWDGWQPLSWAGLPYVLGIGATATVAQLCLTRAYREGRKLVVAALSYLTVVFSSLLGMGYFGDAVHWQEMAGMGMIVLAGVIGAWQR